MALDKEPKIIIAGARIPAIDPMLWGMEEEGIPFDCDTDEVLNQGTAIQKAHLAAMASPLRVGLSFDETYAYLHFKGLPEAEPYARASMTSNNDLMILGINAARMVKGVPFKEYQEGGEIL